MAAGYASIGNLFGDKQPYNPLPTEAQLLAQPQPKAKKKKKHHKSRRKAVPPRKVLPPLAATTQRLLREERDDHGSGLHSSQQRIRVVRDTM